MKRLFIASLLAFAPSIWALDQTGTQHLSDLQQRWAQIQYQLPRTNVLTPSKSWRVTRRPSFISTPVHQSH